MSDTFNLCGREFEVPVAQLRLGVADDRRAAIMFAGPAGAVVLDDRAAELVYTKTEEAADLSDVTAGRVPLLVEHLYSLCDLIGTVEHAVVTAEGGHALVRFGTSPEAERVLALIRDGLPLQFSMCATLLDLAELPAGPEGRRRYEVRRWRFRGNSAAPPPRGRATRVVTHGAGAVAAYQDQEARRRHEPRALAMDTLGAEVWRVWAAVQATALADRFAISDPAFGPALDAAVRSQVERLAERLTGPLPIANAA